MAKAMARATSSLAYPEKFYAAAAYAGFDGSPTSSVSSKFSNDVALLLYALYQQVLPQNHSHFLIKWIDIVSYYLNYLKFSSF